VAHETFDEFCENKVEIDSGDQQRMSLTYGGPPYRLGKPRLEKNRKEYEEVRAELMKRLKEKGIKVQDFIDRA
jgi:hypothetical protein